MRRRTPQTTRVEDADAAPLRRIGRQLAALLIALLCTLLLALLAVVYFRTSASSLQSLRDTLQTNAQGEVLDVIHLAQLSGKGGTIHESKEEEQERGEVFIIFTDAQLKLIGGSSGPFGAALADRAAAVRALRGTSPVFSTVETSSDQTYLICTVPALLHGQAVGIVQTGSSERSYKQSLKALLESLFLVSVFGLAASAGITWLVVHRALTPIRSALSHQRDFVADAAHELRAPLAILRTAAELWLEPGSDDDQQEAVEQVLSQGAHLARLVDDLSLLARADSGAVSIAHERVDLAALTRETVSGVELVAEELGIVLEIQTADAWVHGDAGRLRQMLLILLDNALKHAPGTKTINISVRRQAGHVVVVVRDWGPGIDPADLPHLFDRFYRTDRARSGDGSGLGLAIARWIAVAHDGQIRAGNAPGGGAVFTVTLPFAGE